MSSRLLAVLVFALISTACGLLPGAKSPAPSASAAPTSTLPPSTVPSAPATPVATGTPAPATGAPTPSKSPAPTRDTASDFYLRAWYTQSLPPQYIFSWLPPTTISKGTYINGNVAVPAIYPGPLLIVPVSSTISGAGIAQIVSEATRLGLLGETTDFTGGSPMPGAKLGQLAMTVEGKTYELTGNPDLQIVCITAPCEGAPGSPEAFATFWHDVSMLDTWLPDELGPSEQYVPERVAVLFSETDVAASSPPATVADWPLDAPLEAGTCLTLEGDDVAATLPVLQSATQLIVFAQGGSWLAPTARVLVPGEPSPCGD